MKRGPFDELRLEYGTKKGLLRAKSKRLTLLRKNIEVSESRNRNSKGENRLESSFPDQDALIQQLERENKELRLGIDRIQRKMATESRILLDEAIRSKNQVVFDMIKSLNKFSNQPTLETLIKNINFGYLGLLRVRATFSEKKPRLVSIESYKDQIWQVIQLWYTFWEESDELDWNPPLILLNGSAGIGKRFFAWKLSTILKKPPFIRELITSKKVIKGWNLDSFLAILTWTVTIMVNYSNVFSFKGYEEFCQTHPETYLAARILYSYYFANSDDWRGFLSVIASMDDDISLTQVLKMIREDSISKARNSKNIKLREVPIYIVVDGISDTRKLEEVVGLLMREADSCGGLLVMIIDSAVNILNKAELLKTADFIDIVLPRVDYYSISRFEGYRKSLRMFQRNEVISREEALVINAIISTGGLPGLLFLLEDMLEAGSFSPEEFRIRSLSVIGCKHDFAALLQKRNIDAESKRLIIGIIEASLAPGTVLRAEVEELISLGIFSFSTQGKYVTGGIVPVILQQIVLNLREADMDEDMRNLFTELGVLIGINEPLRYMHLGELVSRFEATISIYNNLRGRKRHHFGDRLRIEQPKENDIPDNERWLWDVLTPEKLNFSAQNFDDLPVRQSGEIESGAYYLKDSILPFESLITGRREDTFEQALLLFSTLQPELNWDSTEIAVQELNEIILFTIEKMKGKGIESETSYIFFEPSLNSSVDLSGIEGSNRLKGQTLVIPNEGIEHYFGNSIWSLYGNSHYHTFATNAAKCTTSYKRKRTN